MEDRTTHASQDATAAHGLAQALPPWSILRGLPVASRLFATHPVAPPAFGSWGWLQIHSLQLASLRLCTCSQYGEARPSGVYVVEVLASLETRPVPQESASQIQAAIQLGAAMDGADKVRSGPLTSHVAWFLALTDICMP